jgi:hypothetical protein
MIITTPEKINNVWGVEIGLKSLEFRVFARATKLIACETILPYDKYIPPNRMQGVFATSLSRTARAQGKHVVPVAVDDLHEVGERLLGPWDAVTILQQPDFTPELLPDFFEISGVMGAHILKHSAELRDTQPQIFTSTASNDIAPLYS